MPRPPKGIKGEFPLPGPGTVRAVGKAVGKIVGYKIIDTKTGAVVGKYGPKGAKRASRRADKLDNEYGAIRYTPRPIIER